MDDQKKKGEVYLVQVKGAAARLIRATDARLARKHALDGIYPPEIEVRRPTTDEAMDMAIDGVAVEDADQPTGMPVCVEYQRTVPNVPLPQPEAE